MNIGDRVTFLETLDRPVETIDGRIIEHSPLLDNKYVHVGGGRFGNVDQPHHSIDWWIDGSFFAGTTIEPKYELVFRSGLRKAKEKGLMRSSEMMKYYKLTNNRPMGINRTRLNFPCLVLISFNRMDVYNDKDVYGDMSVIHYIGAGIYGNQRNCVGNNKSLNNWADYIILLRSPRRGCYKSYGFYRKDGETWVEKQNGRDVFVSRLIKINF
jgi:hypothetical protein